MLVGVFLFVVKEASTTDEAWVYSSSRLALCFRDAEDMDLHKNSNFAVVFGTIQNKIREVYGQYLHLVPTTTKKQWSDITTPEDQDRYSRNDKIYLRVPEFNRPDSIDWWVEQLQDAEDADYLEDPDHWIGKARDEREERGMSVKPKDMPAIRRRATQLNKEFRHKLALKQYRETGMCDPRLCSPEQMGFFHPDGGDRPEIAHGKMITAGEAAGRFGVFVPINLTKSVAIKTPIVFDHEAAKKRMKLSLDA